MNVVLIDSDADVRFAMRGLLEACGLNVLPFADAHFAFLYLLGRVEEIDTVIVNEEVANAVLRRLRALGPVAMATYSDRDLELGTGMPLALVQRAADEELFLD